MRTVKALGYVLIAIGVVLGALSLLGLIDAPSSLLTLPAVGGIIALMIVLRGQRRSSAQGPRQGTS